MKPTTADESDSGDEQRRADTPVSARPVGEGGGDDARPVGEGGGDGARPVDDDRPAEPDELAAAAAHEGVQRSFE